MGHPRLAKEILAGANSARLSDTRFFESSNEAAAAIITEARQGDLIL
jgi:hypothetical protein